MAPWNSSCRLSWNGSSTISQVIGNLERRQRTVLSLPTTYHPAVSERLYGDDRVRTSIDIVGDATLLARLAEIEGLHNLAQLVQPMERHHARLRVRSPAPHLVFNIQAPRYRIPDLPRPRELQLGEARRPRSAARMR